MLDLRGYFLADDKRRVAGSEYVNLFDCGYATNKKGEKQNIVFLIVRGIDIDHDYHGKNCEVPNSAIIFSDTDIIDKSPLLKDIKENKTIKDKVAGYQKKAFDAVTGTDEPYKAGLLSIFLSRLYLGRMADEVIANADKDWSFIDTYIVDGKTITFDSFRPCNLENYGD